MKHGLRVLIAGLKRLRVGVLFAVVKGRAGALASRGFKILTRLDLFLHKWLILKPHAFLTKKFGWYRKLNAGKTGFRSHALLVGSYAILFTGLILGIYRGALAAPDLFDNWDFGTPADFSFDSGV